MTAAGASVKDPPRARCTSHTSGQKLLVRVADQHLPLSTARGLGQHKQDGPCHFAGADEPGIVLARSAGNDCDVFPVARLSSRKS